MKKMTLLFAAVLASGILYAQGHKTFHDFTVDDIYGNTFDLADLKGKKVLVVNTASECALTSQYEELQMLYEKYGGDDFTVIGFPANDFANQEPGTNSEILQFCQANYGVEFPMMSKISVVGEDIHPVYQWLTHKSENGVLDAEVTWNFQKFMIDEDGRVVDFAVPREAPDSERIVNWINSGR